MTESIQQNSSRLNGISLTYSGGVLGGGGYDHGRRHGGRRVSSHKQEKPLMVKTRARSVNPGSTKPATNTCTACGTHRRHGAQLPFNLDNTSALTAQLAEGAVELYIASEIRTAKISEATK